MQSVRLGFEDVELIHSRAEDGSRTELRDSFDIAVSRAVASMNTLCEYDMPYVRIGGRFIAMKGKGADTELADAQNAIREMGGKLIAKHDFILGKRRRAQYHRDRKDLRRRRRIIREKASKSRIKPL